VYKLALKCYYRDS